MKYVIALIILLASFSASAESSEVIYCHFLSDNAYMFAEANAKGATLEKQIRVIQGMDQQVMVNAGFDPVGVQNDLMQIAVYVQAQHWTPNKARELTLMACLSKAAE